MADKIRPGRTGYEITHTTRRKNGDVAASLTAAVQPLTGRRINRGPKQASTATSQPWQAEAWQMYDAVGELRFGVSWLASAVSRCRLIAARQVPGEDEPEPVTDGPVADLLADFAGGRAGQAQLLRRATQQLVVAGDTYVVGRTLPGEMGPDGEPAEEWRAYSTSETSWSGAGWQVNPGDGTIYLDQDDLIFRCWLPHPNRWVEAESSVRSALPVLRELHGLTQRVAAEIDSRLAGAGLLILPQEFTFPSGQAAQSGDANGGEEAFINTLIDYMVTPIKDRESASAVVPLVVTAPGEHIGQAQLIRFWSELDDRSKELREEALDRLARSLDLPPEIIKGLSDSNHWCTLPDVEIMTADGWRTYDQLTPGDLVLTLNHETGLSEWQPVQAVNVWDVVDEPMVEITGKRHHSVTTLNHRWPILAGKPDNRRRAWATTAELLEQVADADPNRQQYNHLILSAPHADLPADPKYADALVELVAWYFTEGNLGERPGRRVPQVVINQSHHVNPDNCARIRRALTALFGPASDTLDKGGRYATPETVERWQQARRMRAENPNMSASAIGREIGVSSTMAQKYLTQEPKLHDQTPRWRETVTRDDKMTRFVLNRAAAEVLLEHAPGRVVTLDFVRSLTAAQLELFIDTAIRGDGHRLNRGKGTPVFSQKDPAMCDAYELALILSGRSSYRYAHTSLGAGADGPREKTQEVTIASNRTTFAPRGRNVREFEHTGVVWCPTTANGTWLARHNGTVFYTGNSAWAISEDGVQMHVAPMLGVLCLALTVGWLRPALAALGVPDADDYLVWYDTTPLELKPDKSEAARELYDRMEIGGDTLRRETGFGDDDAPTDEELRRMILLKFLERVQDPGLLLQALGISTQGLPDLAPAPAIPAPRPAADDQPPSEGPPGTADAARDGDGDAPARTAAATPHSGGLPDIAVVMAAEVAVMRALTYAGRRLLRDQPRAGRSQYAQVPQHELHLHIPLTGHRLDTLIADAWTALQQVLPDRPEVAAVCDRYVRELLQAGVRHEPRFLSTMLCDEAGVCV